MIQLKNGLLFDGSGAAPVVGDVLIDGERIAAVGAFAITENCRVIDCAGLVRSMDAARSIRTRFTKFNGVSLTIDWKTR